MKITQYLSASERGSAADLARVLDVSPVMVSQWARGAKQVPVSRCPDIERATRGRVTAEELRPDVRWRRVPFLGWPHSCGMPLLELASPSR